MSFTRGAISAALHGTIAIGLHYSTYTAQVYRAGLLGVYAAFGDIALVRRYFHEPSVRYAAA